MTIEHRAGEVWVRRDERTARGELYVFGGLIALGAAVLAAGSGKDRILFGTLIVLVGCAARYRTGRRFVVVIGADEVRFGREGRGLQSIDRSKLGGVLVRSGRGTTVTYYGTDGNFLAYGNVDAFRTDELLSAFSEAGIAAR